MVASSNQDPSLGQAQMPSWTTGTCDAGEASIHYLRTGGAKPPLVLLHGLTGNGACWTPVARSLEPDFDVVMPDARGHGRSSTPLHGYRYDDHASDVTGLIRGLELDAPTLLGHSMGGMTAAMLASRSGGLIRRAILADPTFLSPQRQREVCDGAAERHGRLLRRSRDDLLAELRVRHPLRTTEILELLVEARLQTRMDAFDVLTPPSPGFRQLVSTIEVPTLVILGDSSVLSMEMAGELQSLNPRVRIEQIRNAGHGLAYDQPERFAAAVRSFIMPEATA